MNSNQSNNSDGSFHIYLDEKPRINGKLIEKKKEKPKKREKSLFTKKSDAGKGDSPRPTGISPEEWAERWEAIFGKKKLKKEKKNAR